MKNIQTLSLGLITGFLVTLLAACGGSAPPAAGYSLLASGGISAAQGASNTVTLTVKRSGGFDKAIDLGIDGLPAGVGHSFSENPVTGDSSTLTLDVGESTALGTHTLTVKGMANGMEKTATVTLQVTSIATQVEGMSIKNYEDSTQVAQGRYITLEINGKGLDTITQATLGTIDGSIGDYWDVRAASLETTALSPSTTSGFVSISFSIPYGEPVGPKTLTLTSPDGTVAMEDAVTVTPITVGPDGNDAAGRGTPDSPYRSLYYVFDTSKAREGSTVQLLDGTYSTASGETLPVRIRKDVEVEGESRDGVIFQGNGTDTCLEFRGSGALRNLTVQGCNDGVEAETGTVNISEVTFKDNVAIGLKLIDDAVVNVTSSSFSGNDIGIDMSSNSKLSLANSDLINTSSGVHAKDNSQIVMVSSNAADHTNFGLFIDNSASANVSDSTFSANVGAGIASASDAALSVAGTKISGSNIGLYVLTAGVNSVEVDDVTIDQNGYGAAYMSTGGSLKMRGTSITNNVLHGLIIGGDPATVDLGSASEAGKNSFNNNDGFQLFDGRPALAAPTGTVISAVGNQIGGLTMPSGVRTGIDQNVLGTNNYWRIDNANQRIEF